MNTKKQKMLFTIVGLLGLIHILSPRVAQAQSQAADLAARMPADSIAAGQQIATEIIKLGPDGIREIVRMLCPPGAGDDSRARFALNGLAYYVTRPNAESERKLYATVLIEALDLTPDPQVKQFLVSILQLVGKEESVAPLGKLLADPKLCDPATRALIRIRTKGVTPLLLAALPKAEGKSRVTIVRALGKLRAEEAVRTLLPYAKSEETNLRRTALYALANIGAPSAAETLARAAEAKAPYQRAHATALYLTFTRRLAESGKKEECAKICRELIRTRTARRENNVVSDALAILTEALGEGALDDLMAAVDSKNAQIREAALKTLDSLANAESLPKIIGLLLKAKGPKQEEVQRAIVSFCKRIPDVNTRVDPALTALSKTTGADRILLIGVLAQLGGKRALTAVLAEAKSTDADIKTAAARALAGWPDAAAASELLKLAGSAESPEDRAGALRSYVRLLGLPSRRPTEEIARMYEEALKVAHGTEEKRIILAGLSTRRDLESLRVAAKRLDDEDIRAEAAAAIVRIVLPQNEKQTPLQGDEVVEILKKAAAVAPTRIKNQIADNLKNLAWGRSVTTSVAQQGQHAPRLAVDGNSRDLSSAWFGAAWPSWLKVDMKEPAKIDAIHVFFYWDGRRYYQYTVDVSLDDKTWKAVVDMSKNTKPGTSRGVLYRFDPVEARYVRVNILKNSANEAVHLVELKVYAVGTAPELEALAPKPDAEGFIPLFNGKDLTGWVGSTRGYIVEEGGVLACQPRGGGLLHTEEQYSDFIFRFEFKLTPGSNNGVGIRFTRGNPSSSGMEIQILDDSAERYKNLRPYQYHGSIYGVVPCKRGHQKPVGEWNSEEIIADGRHVTVTLNGVKIVDANLDEVATPEILKHRPGLKNKKGYIGFVGHGSRVEFRNIRVKKLKR